MSADSIRKLYRYNQWAWGRVWPSLEQLPDEAVKAERPFFWGSLHGLAVHGAFAEGVWLRRLHGESPQKMWDPAEFADTAAVRARWEAGNQQLQAYLAGLTDTDLARLIHYKNTQGETFSLAQGDILQHLANHGTEHRSQMTPILFQLGVPTPPLDFMIFCLNDK